ncbi:cysteine--tRNA ligase [Patescibacteria group bacterium]|nr:cysteine--tRNA ligase [Patescibacteria group bacterium]MBU1967280.1 cysteine--tRNA ligase [Patescibacteria group bacterium]MBU2543794.1 cysteine--tRNA ligase [Patescibacteria group bacterium]
MQLYNSLTRKIDRIEPFQAPHLGFYACGFTVYDYAHLGHLRRYAMDDVLIRTLKHVGFKVRFVQNITDVGQLASDADTGEDKMEKGAKKYKTPVWEVAKKFGDYFFYSMDKMGNLRPDVSCKATEHIPAQIELIKKLEEKGYTYVIKGDGVYFDTSKLDDYGELARLDAESLKEGARVEKVEGKRKPTDFALWKFEREGEKRAMVWPSPWAERGFPGWHIECSAMAMKYLGEQFEIHTGGKDHLTIHHPNEIAQSQAATGKKPFVKYWVHHNFVQVEGEKMSKSLENFFTIDDVIERGHHPLALKLLFLTAHYRSELNFTWDNLAGSQKSYERLVGLILDYQQAEVESASGVRGDKLPTEKYKQRFFEFMEDDLKTPEAVAILWEVTRSDLANQDKLRLLLEFDQVLGLGLKRAKEIKTELGSGELDVGALPAGVKTLLDQRRQARDNQDFTQADQLREQLHSLGYAVKDTADGQKITQLK